MSTKHTPGPWTMQTVRTDCGVCFKVGPFPWKRGKINHACIYADYPGNGPEYAQLVANALLIAAVPDLLEVARDVDAAYSAIRRDNATLSPDHPAMALWAKARAAIAKATGAQS